MPSRDLSQGVLFSRGSGGHFPARNPSRCHSEEAERKQKSVSLELQSPPQCSVSD